MRLRKYKSVLLVLFDLAIVLFSDLLAEVTSSTTSVTNIRFTMPDIRAVLLMLIIYVFVLFGFDVYKSLWQYAEAREFIACVLASFAGAFVFYLAETALLPDINHRTMYFVLLGVYSAFGMFLARAVYRHFRTSRVLKGTKTKRALLVGAGSAGRELVIYTREYKKAGYGFVCAVDDDISKVGKRIYGLDIVADTQQIGEVCKKHKIDIIIMAIPSVSVKRRKEIIELCLKTGCEVKSLPGLDELEGITNIHNIVSSVRSITPEELLGREPIKVASEKILSFIENKTVAITGGGGSIGSELCRQVAKHNPKQLVIIDIYENNAYDIQQELLQEYKENINLAVHIASVRDYDTINSIFEKHKPNLVIHAAAHKHVPLMETSPKEAVKNNIFGTRNVARAAMANDVEKFLMISTDKAVNPTNIMGATKRICEMIIQSCNGKANTQFMAVRFGNVLGSNGSVIPLFKKQIESGGPVTVTHPDIIRYFMTIPEAAQLVLTAGAMAKGGEVFVLDMGEPVKIDDLAKNLIRLAGLTPGKDIEVLYTGLRPGEKLYEELLLSAEGTDKTENNKIFIGKQTMVDEQLLEKQLSELEAVSYNTKTSNAKIEQEIRKIVPSFKRLVFVDGEYVYEEQE